MLNDGVLLPALPGPPPPFLGLLWLCPASPDSLEVSNPDWTPTARAAGVQLLRIKSLGLEPHPGTDIMVPRNKS